MAGFVVSVPPTRTGPERLVLVQAKGSELREAAIRFLGGALAAAGLGRILEEPTVPAANGIEEQGRLEDRRAVFRSAEHASNDDSFTTDELAFGGSGVGMLKMKTELDGGSDVEIGSGFEDHPLFRHAADADDWGDERLIVVGLGAR